MARVRVRRLKWHPEQNACRITALALGCLAKQLLRVGDGCGRRGALRGRRLRPSQGAGSGPTRTHVAVPLLDAPRRLQGLVWGHRRAALPAERRGTSGGGTRLVGEPGQGACLGAWRRLLRQHAARLFGAGPAGDCLPLHRTPERHAATHRRSCCTCCVTSRPASGTVAMAEEIT